MKLMISFIATLILVYVTAACDHFGNNCALYNVAEGKNATQSSTLLTYGGPYTASLAVDGNTSQNFDGGKSCSHTDGANAWWKVQLGLGMYSINQMKIFLRYDYRDRNVGLKVYVDDNLCYTLQSTSSVILDIHCGSTLKGNTVKVQIPGALLSLCEVQVFVDCSDGFYGDNCTRKCGSCKDGNSCNKTNGVCEDGCGPGYETPKCQDCSDGFYGDNCASKCGSCKDDNPCDKTNGICEDGCGPGYETPKCQNCSDGYYGADCIICGRCKNGKSCNKTDGVCTNGCETNFESSQCHVCIQGRYGQDCSSLCGQCKGEQGCEKTTGHCPRGCQPGYFGTFCVQECSDFTYGDNCTSVCNCLNQCEVCDKVTGACRTGYHKSDDKSSVSLIIISSLFGSSLVALGIIGGFYIRLRKELARYKAKREEHYTSLEERTEQPVYDVIPGAHPYINVSN